MRKFKALSVLEEQRRPTRLLDHDHVINFVHDSIRGHNITFSNSCVSDYGSSVAIDAKALLVNGLDGADKRPVRGHDTSAAENVCKERKIGDEDT